MKQLKRPTALILVGSSGLGAATAIKLAKEGFDLILIHRDRKADMPEIEERFNQIREHGAGCLTFNADATNPLKQNELWEEIRAQSEQRKVNVLVHSIAKGNLKPMTGDNVLSNQDFQLTLQAMATSLYDWVQLISRHQGFSKDARIIAFTSEGNRKAIPHYGAVSAAKASLESIVRNIAQEFAPKGIKANCIQAGVTDTASLRRIPNYEIVMENALARNPNNRLTTPEDVANSVYLLTRPEAKWITGTVIKVDGGESLQ